MGYWLGIDLGSTFTAAAVCRVQDGRCGSPELVGLGDRSAAVSSVVFLGEAGRLVVGEAAERRALTDPDRVLRGFKRRIGDDVPLVVGGVSYAAPEIAAMVVRWVVERVAAREGGPAAGIVLTHPAGWGTYKRDVLAGALRAADLGQIGFVTEPEAAAAGYAAQERVELGSTVAVYDLGGGTFDAAVVRKTDTGGFSVLGQPQGLEQLGGVDFDDAVFAHVLTAVPALAELDGQDPAVMTAMAALRRECTAAKEALSADTEVTIPVLAPGIQSQVRMVRTELEDMIHAGVSETVQALRRTLRSAQLEDTELDVVLLVGGSSRVPLVSQLVSAELGRPVAVDADPKAAIALGAALLACPVESVADRTASEAPTPAPIPLPERPSLTAHSAGVESAELESDRTRSRRVKQVALAGALALATAAGVASIPFLIAHSDPTPPATSGVPPPAAPPAAPPALDVPEMPPPNPGAASPVPRAETGSDTSSLRTNPDGPVRTTPAAAPILPPAGGATPDPPPSPRPPPSWSTTRTWTRSWSSPPPTTTTSPTPPSTTTTPPPTTTTPPVTTDAPTPTPTTTSASRAAPAPPAPSSQPQPRDASQAEDVVSGG